MSENSSQNATNATASGAAAWTPPTGLWALASTWWFFCSSFCFFSLFIKPDTTSGRGFSLRNQRHHMVIQQQLVNHQVALAQGIPWLIFHVTNKLEYFTNGKSCCKLVNENWENSCPQTVSLLCSHTTSNDLVIQWQVCPIYTHQPLH